MCLHLVSDLFLKSLIYFIAKLGVFVFCHPEIGQYVLCLPLQYVTPNLRLNQKYAFIKKSTIFAQSLQKLEKMWSS